VIFRVYGYTHPRGAYICDPEYAPAGIFKSKDPKAYRAKGKQIHYKFYTDEGLQFVKQNYPEYTIRYEPLQASLVGVKEELIKETRQPDKALQSMLRKQPADNLLKALIALYEQLHQRTNLSKTDLGVFGSLLHNFYHPRFSDLDFIVYGRKKLKELAETLSELYREADTPLRNEFDSFESVKDKHWKFKNYSLQEYVWHQERKRVYALFQHKESQRTIKTEFEPVKRWEEIKNEYSARTRIIRQGWTKIVARVTEDKDAAFIPSIYQIDLSKILEGKKVEDIRRVVSYVEEFRMQAQQDELVLVEGNLELVKTPRETFHQVALTHGERYYEQTLKVLD